MYTKRLEKRPVDHVGCLFVTHTQRLALFRDLFTVQKQRKIDYVLMQKFVRVAVQRTDKICVLYPGEQETFRGWNEGGVFYRQEF